MAERRHKVTDEGALHRYRTEIPNTVIRGVMGRGLSLPARWLYVYLKSVAGDSGECWQNMTTLAVGSQLSRGAVSNARKELIAAKLIALTKGKGALHETDRIRILDVWNQNMAEFYNDASSCGELDPSSLSESEEAKACMVETPSQEIRVHHMNPSSSPHELASSCGEPKKISLKKETQELETTSLTLPGTGNEVSDPGTTEDSVDADGVVKPKRERRKVRRLDEGDWLWLELQHYTAEFDIHLLNDADWWDNVANSFPVFDRSWVPLAFASLAQWQQANPTNRCRSERGWKKRLNYSLNFYYDKYMRRQAYAKAPQRVR